MRLTKRQQKQFDRQIAAHKHKSYSVDIELGAGHALKGLKVRESILRPEIMSSLQLAQWLFFNCGLFKNKMVLDMGCGTGIQGVVMGLYGARKIVLADVSKDAVQNAKANIKQYGLENKAEAQESNLFQDVKGKFDVIVFNHPFFSDGTMEEQVSTPVGKIGRGSLIHVFLQSAKKHLRQDGLIIMPYYHLAGPLNNPAVQAPKHGYSVDERFRVVVKSGIQQGPVSIYILSPR